MLYQEIILVSEDRDRDRVLGQDNNFHLEDSKALKYLGFTVCNLEPNAYKQETFSLESLSFNRI
jgi:hypothetical protein